MQDQYYQLKQFNFKEYFKEQKQFKFKEHFILNSKNNSILKSILKS